MTIDQITERIRQIDTEREVLTSLLGERQDIPRAVLNAVSVEFLVDKPSILSSKRHNLYVTCRQACMYILREEYGYPYERIAAFFNKTHATVIHSCRVINGYLDTTVMTGKDINTNGVVGVCGKVYSAINLSKEYLSNRQTRHHDN